MVVTASIGAVWLPNPVLSATKHRCSATRDGAMNIICLSLPPHPSHCWSLGQEQYCNVLGRKNLKKAAIPKSANYPPISTTENTAVVSMVSLGQLPMLFPPFTIPFPSESTIVASIF